MNIAILTFSIYTVYRPKIRKYLAEFIEQWNHHGLSTVRSQSLLQLWTIAHLEGNHYENLVGTENVLL